MRVTIAIPCYKQAEYLPEAVESALAQTYQDTEIIIVNDGSPDDTGKIAAQYQLQHPFKIKVIDQVNKGLASARNSAIMAMSGDYFMPLDADDILMSNCIERLIEAAQETNADIIGPSLRTFGLAQETIILDKEPTRKEFLSGNRLGYFSMIKKGALIECGGYSPRMDAGFEDYHLWFDLLGRGKRAITVSEPLVLYRTKEQSMWRDAEKQRPKLMAQIFKDFPELLPKEIKTI